MIDVSRETSVQAPRTDRRPYHSPYRRKQSARTRQALIEATLAFIAEGNWRPRAGEIACRAGVDPSLVGHYFRSLPMLYCAVAQERTADVLRSLQIEPLDDERTGDLQRDLAWIVMTGTRRPRL